MATDIVNRSGNPYSLPRDGNRVPAVGGVLQSDGKTVQPLEIDGSGNLLVNIAAGTVVVNPSVASVIYNGLVTASGTRGALGSQALTQGVTLEALSTNTVSVFVGNSTVTTSNGLELPAGASVTIPANNLSLVYVVCVSTSPVVTYIGV